MTITALPDPPSRDDPTTFSSKADAFFGGMPTFVTEANAMAAAVNGNATTAATAAGVATSAASAASADAASADADAATATAAAATATTKAAEAAASAALATGFLGQFQTLTTSQTLAVNKAYEFSGSGQTYTLPSGAVNGDVIIISNKGTDLTNVIGRGGKTIGGSATDMTFNAANTTITLKCDGTDWRFIK